MSLVGVIEKVTKHVPVSDVTACIFWLKNRKPKKWRDKQGIEQKGEMAVNIIDNIPRNNKEK